MNIEIVYLIHLWLAICVNSVLIFLLIRKPERSLTSISFILFLFLIDIWAISQFLIQVFHGSTTFVEILDKTAALGYTFIPVAFLIFVLAFTGRTYFLRKFNFLLPLFLPAIIFIFLSWNTNLVEIHNQLVHQEWGYSTSPSILFGLFIAWFEIVMLSALGLLIYFYRKSLDRVKKRQSLWLILAISIPLSLGSITDGILPIFNINLFPSALPLTSIMAILIGYAISKYELFEISPTKILSSLGNAVVSVDGNERIILFNDAAENMLRISKDKMIGRVIYEVFDLRNSKGEIIPREKRPLKIALTTKKKTTSSEYLLSAKNKKPLPVFITINPVITDKQVLGATISLRDITAEKELEKNKDDFIRVASHELKTPITSMKLYNQLLINHFKDRKDIKSLHFLQKLDQQLKTLSQLAGNLLDVSRIQSGVLEIKPEEFEVSALIKEVVENLRRIKSKPKLVIEKDEPAVVSADRARIAEVLTNFITNAMRYASDTEKIFIKSEKSRRQIKVSVKDLGPGIPLKFQRKIFERNYQLSTSKGLGLGLYISSKIIQEHNGKIGVISKLGKGSTFFFSLPFK